MAKKNIDIEDDDLDDDLDDNEDSNAHPDEDI